MRHYHNHTQQRVLKLDIGGIPEGWISHRDAAELIAKDLVAWTLGSTVGVFRGGYSKRGSRTTIEIPSIVAVRGTSNVYLPDLPIAVTREKLCLRDRNMCAYCGDVLPTRELEAEHILPKSRGGAWSWMNLVAACTDCNQFKKRDRTPEEAGMPLLYLPYIPNHWEDIIMEGRNILADQMDFLLGSLPKHSRLLAS